MNASAGDFSKNSQFTSSSNLDPTFYSTSERPESGQIQNSSDDTPEVIQENDFLQSEGYEKENPSTIMVPFLELSEEDDNDYEFDSGDGLDLGEMYPLGQTLTVSREPANLAGQTFYNRRSEFQSEAPEAPEATLSVSDDSEALLPGFNDPIAGPSSAKEHPPQRVPSARWQEKQSVASENNRADTNKGHNKRYTELKTEIEALKVRISGLEHLSQNTTSDSARYQTLQKLQSQNTKELVSDPLSIELNEKENTIIKQMNKNNRVFIEMLMGEHTSKLTEEISSKNKEMGELRNKVINLYDKLLDINHQKGQKQARAQSQISSSTPIKSSSKSHQHFAPLSTSSSDSESHRQQFLDLVSKPTKAPGAAAQGAQLTALSNASRSEGYTVGTKHSHSEDSIPEQRLPTPRSALKSPFDTKRRGLQFDDKDLEEYFKELKLHEKNFQKVYAPEKILTASPKITIDKSRPESLPPGVQKFTTASIGQFRGPFPHEKHETLAYPEKEPKLGKDSSYKKKRKSREGVKNKQPLSIRSSKALSYIGGTIRKTLRRSNPT